MTKGQVIAFMAVVRMNTAQTLDEVFAGSNERTGTKPQGSNVMAAVWFIFAAGLTVASDIFRFLFVHETKLQRIR